MPSVSPIRPPSTDPTPPELNNSIISDLRKRVAQVWNQVSTFVSSTAHSIRKFFTPSVQPAGESRISNFVRRFFGFQSKVAPENPENADTRSIESKGAIKEIDNEAARAAVLDSLTNMQASNNKTLPVIADKTIDLPMKYVEDMVRQTNILKLGKEKTRLVTEQIPTVPTSGEALQLNEVNKRAFNQLLDVFGESGLRTLASVAYQGILADLIVKAATEHGLVPGEQENYHYIYEPMDDGTKLTVNCTLQLMDMEDPFNTAKFRYITVQRQIFLPHETMRREWVETSEERKEPKFTVTDYFSDLTLSAKNSLESLNTLLPQEGQ